MSAAGVDLSGVDLGGVGGKVGVAGDKTHFIFYFHVTPHLTKLTWPVTGSWTIRPRKAGVRFPSYLIAGRIRFSWTEERERERGCVSWLLILPLSLPLLSLCCCVAAVSPLESSVLAAASEPRWLEISLIFSRVAPVATTGPRQEG